MSADTADADTEPSEEEEEAVAQLFGTWSVTGITFEDPSTERYITVSPVAHTMGRHARRQFRKSELSIVERLINRLMQDGRNTGKKQRAHRIIRTAFDTIHERTGENPVQVLVRAVENAAPREETVRLKYGGISVPKAVDTGPQRRVDQALKFIAQGTHSAAFKSPVDVEEALADQLIGAATYAVAQKGEQERVAAAAR
jgi:small subunit ribosomal protein S7